MILRKNSSFRLLPEPAADETAYLCPEGCRAIAGNDVDLLRDGEEAFPRMLGAIALARQWILLETYCFAADFVGRLFARALAERARAGISVRVLYDAAGSHATPRSFFGRLREAGVQVQVVNPIRKFLLHGLPFSWRDHRKVLAVDGRVAFVGGLNLAKAHAPCAQGGLGWRDTAVELRGPVAAEIGASCARIWEREARSAGPAAPSADEPDPEGRNPVLVLESDRRRRAQPFSSSLRCAVQRARRRVWISNPYFLPPRSLRRAIRGAARRGVDVRLLLPRTSDSLVALLASQSGYGRFLRWGVRLFEWPGPMMHSKTAVVDGLWSTVGSYNLDRLSLLHNRELSVVLLGRAFGSRMEAVFERDFAASVEIDPERWKRRGLLRKAGESVCSAFRLLL